VYELVLRVKLVVKFVVGVVVVVVVVVADSDWLPQSLHRLLLPLPQNLRCRWHHEEEKQEMKEKQEKKEGEEKISHFQRQFARTISMLPIVSVYRVPTRLLLFELNRGTLHVQQDRE